MNALLAPVVFPSSCPELRNVAGLASVLGAVPATPAVLVLTKQRAVPCKGTGIGLGLGLDSFWREISRVSCKPFHFAYLTEEAKGSHPLQVK